MKKSSHSTPVLATLAVAIAAGVVVGMAYLRQVVDDTPLEPVNSEFTTKESIGSGTAVYGLPDNALGSSSVGSPEASRGNPFVLTHSIGGNAGTSQRSTPTPPAGFALSGGGSGPTLINGGSNERAIDSIVNEGLKTAPIVQDGASDAVCTDTQLPPGNLLYRIDLKWSDGAGRKWERETVGFPGAHIYFSLQFPGKNLLEISVYDKEGGIRQRVAGRSTISATVPFSQAECRRNTRPDERAVLYVLRQGPRGLETDVFYGRDATTNITRGLSRPS